MNQRLSLIPIAAAVGVTALYGLTSGPQKFPPETFANSLVRINPVTGTTTVIGPTGLTGLGEGDIMYNPANGLLYGLASLSLLLAGVALLRRRRN